MLVSVKRKKYSKTTIGAISVGRCFAGAKTGKWFQMCSNGGSHRAFSHMETGKLTQVTPRIARQKCYPVDAVVLRSGEVGAGR